MFFCICVATIFKFVLKPINKLVYTLKQLPETDDIQTLPTEKNDDIGKASKRLRDFMKDSDLNNWIREGQIKVVSAARGNDCAKESAYEILKTLCSVLKTPLGAYYQVTDDKNLSLLAGYCLRGHSKAEKKLLSRDTVLSSVLEDGFVIVDNNLPDDYYKIHTGLGSTTPKHRLIAPVVIERQVIGLIELSGVKPFLDHDVAFVEQVLEAIGLAVTAATNNEKIKLMYDEAIQQQKELKASNKTLESQTRELEVSRAELEAQAQDLENANKDIESQSAEIQAQNQQLSNQAEEINARMKQIEQASKYKSQFLANMSHELRTPLNSLLILAKSFKDNDDGNLTPDQIEEADMIYSGGVELLELINDILDLSKIEAGQISVKKVDESLLTLTQKIERQFMPLISGKDINFSVTLEKSCPDKLFTDVHRLEQILKNLLSNAIKFTKEGSVNLTIAKKEDSILFSVKDTGIGISDDKQTEIFEAFKQEDGSIDRQYGGTGLGLSISKQLAQLLDGRIDLKSQKGKGSEFTLSLPMNLKKTSIFLKQKAVMIIKVMT